MALKKTLRSVWFSLFALLHFTTSAQLSSNEKVYTDLSQALKNPLSVIHLDLSHQNLYQVSSQIQLFEKLVSLNLSGNNLKSLEGLDFSNQRNLIQIKLNDNRFSTFPQELLTAKQLIILDIGFNKIDSIPSSLSSLKFLETLRLHHNHLSHLPFQWKNRSLKRLRIDGNKIEVIPEVVFENHPKLIYFNANNNQLSSLPVSFFKLPLKTLDLGNNNFRDLSAVKQLSRLSFLVLDWNKINMPTLEALVDLKRLQVLSLEYCNLKSLPNSWKKMKRLKHLSLIGNARLRNKKIVEKLDLEKYWE